jgi:hypothetical protein
MSTSVPAAGAGAGAGGVSVTLPEGGGVGQIDGEMLGLSGDGVGEIRHRNACLVPSGSFRKQCTDTTVTPLGRTLEFGLHWNTCA